MFGVHMCAFVQVLEALCTCEETEETIGCPALPFSAYFLGIFFSLTQNSWLSSWLDGQKTPAISPPLPPSRAYTWVQQHRDFMWTLGTWTLTFMLTQQTLIPTETAPLLSHDIFAWLWQFAEFSLKPSTYIKYQLYLMCIFAHMCVRLNLLWGFCHWKHPSVGKVCKWLCVPSEPCWRQKWWAAQFLDSFCLKSFVGFKRQRWRPATSVRISPNAFFQKHHPESSQSSQCRYRLTADGGAPLH